MVRRLLLALLLLIAVCLSIFFGTFWLHRDSLEARADRVGKGMTAEEVEAIFEDPPDEEYSPANSGTIVKIWERQEELAIVAIDFEGKVVKCVYQDRRPALLDRVWKLLP